MYRMEKLAAIVVYATLDGQEKIVMMPLITVNQTHVSTMEHVLV